MTWLSGLMKQFRLRAFSSTDDESTSLEPPVVPALLPDIPDGEPNLLPRSAWLAPLEVEIPPWLNSNPSAAYPEHLWVYWGSDEIEHKTFTQPVGSADLIIWVPPQRLSEGLHQLSYKAKTSNAEEANSRILTITIDKTPPILVNEGPLIFPPAVVSGGVTEQYLNDNNDQVLAEVPDYLSPKPGDVITWYWSSSPTGSEIAGSRTLVLADIGQPIMLPFAGQLIRDRGDGTRYGFYRIEDRSGNDSPRSLAVQLQVSAQPVPRVLPAPTISEASGNTLNPLNAISGATVVIPAAAVIKPGEKVFVQWAAPGSVGSHRAEVSAGQRQYKVPGDRVPQHFGKSIPVYYEVEESGVVEPHVSVTRNLAVSRITSGWPTVQCDKVSGSQLDLSSFTGDANFTLERWSFMAAGQYVNVAVAGLEDSTDRNLTIPVLTDYQVPQAGAPIGAGRIAKTELMRFRRDLLIAVQVEVSFNEKQDYQTFPSLTVRLVD